MSLYIYIEEAGQLVAQALLDPFTRVEDLKRQVEDQIRIPADTQRLFYRGQELTENKILDDYGIITDSVLTLVVRQRSALREAISAYGPLPCPLELHDLIERAKQGIIDGLAPKLSEEGIGGTYFLRDLHEKVVAVFKPADEEAFCPNNPKNYVGEMDQEGFRPGVRSGEGSVREVAAYLLDHGGLADVPMTIRAEMPRSVFQQRSEANADMAGPGISSRLELSQLTGAGGESSTKAARNQLPTKIGSLQEFVESDDMVSDVSPSKFNVEEVHKIAILDIRLLNTDRNDGNILVRYECDSPRNTPSSGGQSESAGGGGSSSNQRSWFAAQTSSSPTSTEERSARISPRQQQQQLGMSQPVKGQTPLIVGTPVQKSMRVFDGLLSSRHRSPSTISVSVQEEDAESLGPEDVEPPIFSHRSPSQPLAIPGRSLGFGGVSSVASTGSRGGAPGLHRAGSGGGDGPGSGTRRAQPQQQQPAGLRAAQTHDYTQLQVGSTKRYDSALLAHDAPMGPELKLLAGNDDDDDEDVSFFFAAMASSVSSPPDDSNHPLLALRTRGNSLEMEVVPGRQPNHISGVPPIAAGPRVIRSYATQLSTASSLSSTHSGATHPWLPRGMRAQLNADTPDDLSSSDGSRTPAQEPPAGGGGRPRMLQAGGHFDEPSHPLMIQGSRGPMAAQHRAMARLHDEDEPGFLGKSAPVHAPSPLLMMRMQRSAGVQSDRPAGWGAPSAAAEGMSRQSSLGGPPGAFSPGGAHQVPPPPHLTRGVSVLAPALSEDFGAELASRRSLQPSNCARERGGKCQHRRVRLIPIDHSNSLPDTMGITWADWVWLDWPQAKEPLSESMRAYIENLDIERDVELLRTTLSIREPCLRLMRISNLLLKKGVRAGLSLYDIAKLICREDMDKPSQLEIACWHALALARANNKKMSLTVGGNTVVANLPDVQGFHGAFRRRRAHSMGSLMDMNINMDGFGLSEGRDKDKSNGAGNSHGLDKQQQQHQQQRAAMRGRSKQFEKEVAEIEGRMFFLSLDTTLDHLLDLVKALRSRKTGEKYTPVATFTPALTSMPSTPNSVSSMLLGVGKVNSGPLPRGHGHSRELSLYPRGPDSFGVGPQVVGSLGGGGGGGRRSGRRSVVGVAGPSGIFHEIGPQDWIMGDPEDDLEMPVGSAPVPVLVPHLLSQRNLRGSSEAATSPNAHLVESLYGPGVIRSRASSVSAQPGIRRVVNPLQVGGGGGAGRPGPLVVTPLSHLGGPVSASSGRNIGSVRSPPTPDALHASASTPGGGFVKMQRVQLPNSPPSLQNHDIYAMGLQHPQPHHHSHPLLQQQQQQQQQPLPRRYGGSPASQTPHRHPAVQVRPISPGLSLGPTADIPGLGSAPRPIRGAAIPASAGAAFPL